MTWTDELKVIGCQAELRRLADLWATIKEALEPNPSAGDKVSGTRNLPAPIRLDLSQWIYEFELLFVTHFTHELCDAYPELRPPADTPGRLRLLADRAGFFDEAFGEELHERANQLEHLLAPKEKPRRRGDCPTPECPGDLYQRPHHNGAKCPECGTWWDDGAINEFVGEKMRDRLMTRPELAHALKLAGIKLTRQAIHNWIKRGRLQPRGDGLFSFAEAYELGLATRAKTG